MEAGSRRQPSAVGGAGHRVDGSSDKPPEGGRQGGQRLSPADANPEIEQPDGSAVCGSEAADGAARGPGLG
eukprot:5986201-Heterocapsa_arctica.AAC.1